MIEVKAPNNYMSIWKKDTNVPIVFLAGSIEMGTAEKWQDRVASMLKDEKVILLNPRRDDWDSSWKQTIDDPQFSEQVRWEQLGLIHSDIVFFYFDSSTKSPITLLEFGQVLERSWHTSVNESEMCQMIVCCPQGFWRRGNLEVLCKDNGLELYNDLDSAVECLRSYITDRSN